MKTSGVSLLLIILILGTNQAYAQIEFSNEIGSILIEDEIFYQSNQSSQEFVKIFGIVNEYVKGGKVTIIITNPDGITEGSQIFPTKDGYYETYFSIKTNSPVGIYKIDSTYHGKVIGNVYFELKSQAEKLKLEREIAQKEAAEREMREREMREREAREAAERETYDPEPMEREIAIEQALQQSTLDAAPEGEGFDIMNMDLTPYILGFIIFLIIYGMWKLRHRVGTGMKILGILFLLGLVILLIIGVFVLSMFGFIGEDFQERQDILDGLDERQRMSVEAGIQQCRGNMAYLQSYEMGVYYEELCMEKMRDLADRMRNP